MLPTICSHQTCYPPVALYMSFLPKLGIRESINVLNRLKFPLNKCAVISITPWKSSWLLSATLFHLWFLISASLFDVAHWQAKQKSRQTSSSWTAVYSEEPDLLYSFCSHDGNEHFMWKSLQNLNVSEFSLLEEVLFRVDLRLPLS